MLGYVVFLLLPLLTTIFTAMAAPTSEDEQRAKPGGVKAALIFNTPRDSNITLSNSPPLSTMPSVPTTCSDYTCPLGGTAAYNNNLQACACPNPPCQPLPCPVGLQTGYINQECTCVDPCTDDQCDDGTNPSFNPFTKTCLCPAHDPGLLPRPSASASPTLAATLQPFLPPAATQASNAAALIQQALANVPETTGAIYSAKLYAAEGFINFQVQLMGQPLGFEMNASTTISAGNIATENYPSVVIVPKYMKNTNSQSVQVTAQIVAVNFSDRHAIRFYCQLGNGTVVTTTSDKYVHFVGLMDPSKPPVLAVMPYELTGKLTADKRDSTIRAVSDGISPRALSGISANTVTASEAACAAMSCLDSGSPPTFNNFTRACYCQLLAVPETVPLGVVKKERDESANPPICSCLPNNSDGVYPATHSWS